MKHGKIIIWLSIFCAVFIWSGINPHRYFSWFFEALPAMIGFGLIVGTYRKFKFTELVYWCILVHAVIILIGAHYLYSHMPLFEAFKGLFGWERNNYDKLAHLAQGFVPALVLRELIIRFEVIKDRAWTAFLIIASTLGFSALYEIIEWTTTLHATTNSLDLIGMQGYVWDSQTDMLFALIGAILALSILSGVHDKQLRHLKLYGYTTRFHFDLYPVEYGKKVIKKYFTHSK